MLKYNEDISDTHTYPFSGSCTRIGSNKRAKLGKRETSTQEMCQKKIRKGNPQVLGQGALRLVVHARWRGQPAHWGGSEGSGSNFCNKTKWTGCLGNLNIFTGELNDPQELTEWYIRRKMIKQEGKWEGNEKLSRQGKQTTVHHMVHLRRALHSRDHMNTGHQKKENKRV